ncbi:MAG: hypothetical protein FWG13_03660 [Leptospirales bacterium]|nr:hypothetical protein [Leptospirales bacterium]
MVRTSLFCFLIASVVIIYAVNSDRQEFRRKLIEYMDGNAPPESLLSGTSPEASSIPLLPHTLTETDSTSHQNNDWDSLLISQNYTLAGEPDAGRSIENDEVPFISYGSIKMNLHYGKVAFTDRKYRRSDDAAPVSLVVTDGFFPEQEMQLHIEGKLNDRLTIYVDHDSNSENNRYYMNYKALEEDEFIQEINAGEIDIKFNKSKYATYENMENKGMGVDVTLRKNNFQITAFGSAARGKSVEEVFRGASSSNSVRIPECSYLARTYYQLEPYICYDNVSAPPSFPAGYNLNTFQSHAGAAFTQTAVNIDPSGFSVYMDDQNPYNNYDAIQLPLDGGYYSLLSNGSDYSVNYSSGLITFLKSIPRDARIFVVYKLKGRSSMDPAVKINSMFPGLNFVFIKYGASMDEDPGRDGSGGNEKKLDAYEVRSVFFLGKRNLLSRNFSLKFYNRAGLLNSEQVKKLGSYSVSYSDGTVSFRLREPFRQLAGKSAGIIYAERQADNVSDSSMFYMAADYYSESRSFQLKHSNIIENSERVKINGRTLDRSLYSMDYLAGYLSFNNPNNPQIMTDTIIEVAYQYQPLGSRSDDFIGGARVDYKINKNVSIGGSSIVSSASKGSVIPRVNGEPARTILVEGDVSVDLDPSSLAKIYNVFADKKRKTMPFSVKGYAEYARSYRNVNIFGKALIENMESSDDSLILSMSEKDWVLSSMRPGVEQSARGLLYYRYYRDADNPGSLKGRGYNARSVPYSRKPGPYNIADGHIPDSIEDSSSQMSLVFDYDFSGGNEVSVAVRELAETSVDLSGLQYAEVYYKLESANPSDSVKMYLDIGKINEDSDGTGILSTEDLNHNGVLDIGEDIGYPFYGNNPTIVGSGPGFNSITIGDGVLNTKDLNRNGKLDTEDDPNNLKIKALLTSQSWTKVRLYADTFSPAKLNLLKETESIRFSLQGANGAKGKLYVSKIRFVMSRWRNAQTDGQPAAPANLKVTYLNTLNDDDYRAESFMRQNRRLYESLYGKKNDGEIDSSSEGCMQLEYTISGQNVSIERRFTENLDLRFYKTFSVWYNYRSSNSGDALRVRLGSSENDYYEYNIPLGNPKLWQEARLKLRPDSSADIPASVSGNPDVRRIDRIKLYIDAPAGNTGKIWINDMYVSDPMNLVSDAYWYEGDFKTTEPVFKTANGTPVFSDINIKYTNRGRSAQFTSIGQPITDIGEKYQQVLSSVTILPALKATFDYTFEETDSDSLDENLPESLRGKTKKNTFYMTTSFTSENSGIPSIFLSNKSELYANTLTQGIAGESVYSVTDSFTHSPSLVIDERIDNWLQGTLSGQLKFDFFFAKNDITRESKTISRDDLKDLISVVESEKRQRNNVSFEMNYCNEKFFIKETCSFYTEAILEYVGKSYAEQGILDNFQGGFCAPFVYNDNMKFVQRDRNMTLALGINDYGFISPRYSFELAYRENSFRDYNHAESASTDNFARCRDAQSAVETKIDIPLNLNRLSQTGKLSFIKSLNASFSRSLYLSENSVPYEGEGASPFREEYGITNSLCGIMPAGLDLFHYYPGYMFTGRNMAARGRDYIYDTFNETINSGTLEFPNYNNALKIIENYSLNMFSDFTLFTMNTGCSLNQVCARTNVFGVPQQIVTRTLSNTLNFDLMEIFDFGFFRPNASGLAHHSSSLEAGCSINNHNMITSNRMENEYNYSLALTFKWDRTYFRISGGIDIRRERWYEFIPENDSRSHRDDIYYNNIITSHNFMELDTGYNFSIVYETDLKWMYNLLLSLYQLTGEPIFKSELTVQMKAYEYAETTSPEPYDLYMLTNTLTLDLHKYVQGSLSSVIALENFRDVGTNGIRSQVFSYAVTFQLALIF